MAAWPIFTAAGPLRVLVSGCLAGLMVGYDGTNFGGSPVVSKLAAMSKVQVVPFCPEDLAFGTPRVLCDIHGGDGHDVLAGRARVLSAEGQDWTDPMIAAAHTMLRVAQTNQVRLAILMDISAACGSQVIYAGARTTSPHRMGQGVCAALLVENGIPVVSQRDFSTLDKLLSTLDPRHEPDPAARDHHESDWYVGYFKS